MSFSLRFYYKFRIMVRWKIKPMLSVEKTVLLICIENKGYFFNIFTSSYLNIGNIHKSTVIFITYANNKGNKNLP